MASTSTPFDIFEPYYIVRESQTRLHNFSVTKDEATAHAEWQWLIHDGRDESVQRIYRLRIPFLRAARDAGFSLENAGQVYANMTEVHDRIYHVVGKLTTKHFHYQREKLVKRLLKDESDIEEALWRESLNQNREVLQAFDMEYFNATNAYTRLASDIHGLTSLGPPKEAIPIVPFGGKFIPVGGDAKEVKSPTSWKILNHFWNRSHDDYDSLCGDDGAFPEIIQDTSIRSRIAEANNEAKRIGLPWHLKPDSKTRHVTKVEGVYPPRADRKTNPRKKGKVWKSDTSTGRRARSVLD